MELLRPAASDTPRIVLRKTAANKHIRWSSDTIDRRTDDMVSDVRAVNSEHKEHLRISSLDGWYYGQYLACAAAAFVRYVSNYCPESEVAM